MINRNSTLRLRLDWIKVDYINNSPEYVLKAKIYLGLGFLDILALDKDIKQRRIYTKRVFVHFFEECP